MRVGTSQNIHGYQAGLLREKNAVEINARSCRARKPADIMLLSLTKRERRMLSAVWWLLLLGTLGMLVLRHPRRTAGDSGFSGRASEASAQSAP